MAVLAEWECALHGVFECTHPCCPAFNCDSSQVKRVFVTPPHIGSQTLKRFDKGIKRSAEMYGISNFRTAREGEAAYGGGGNGVLWGDQIQKTLGVDMSALQAAAQRPFKVPGRNEVLTNNNPMREVATELGITKRVLPKPAEEIRSKHDK